MRNNMNMTAMNDDALVRVTGGDKCDTYWEKKTGTPLYSAGDTVEVYDSWLHIQTDTATVLFRGYALDGSFTYQVQIHETGKIKWVPADDIEND